MAEAKPNRARLYLDRLIQSCYIELAAPIIASSYYQPFAVSAGKVIIGSLLGLLTQC